MLSEASYFIQIGRTVCNAFIKVAHRNALRILVSSSLRVGLIPFAAAQFEGLSGNSVVKGGMLP